ASTRCSRTPRTATTTTSARRPRDVPHPARIRHGHGSPSVRRFRQGGLRPLGGTWSRRAMTAANGAGLDTLRLSAEEARGVLERGEVSGAELFAAYRAAIDERNDGLNAFLTLVDDPGGEGVPIALKDVISTKGVRTTAGSKILDNYVPVFDSTVAARCKAHGLRLLGK